MKPHTPLFLLAMALVLAAAVRPAQARLHRSWTYEELFAAADLVVIARPTATVETGVQAALPDIESVDASGKVSPVMGDELETRLEVVAVMKGKLRKRKGKKARVIVLRHYEEASSQPSINGPGLVAFDPTAGTQYLMFLVREKDGRYVAVSGQTDPDMAIEPLALRAP